MVSATPALAQVAAPVTITPPTLAPEKRDGGYRVDIPEMGAIRPPAGAEGLFVTPGAIVVESGFAAVAPQLAAAIDAVRGQRVSLARLYALASKVEAIHARAGYVLARVSVPPQDLIDGGTLRIVVTDGFVARVDVSHRPECGRR